MRLPSLPLAVGVYLPVSTMATVFCGGLLRWGIQRRAASEVERQLRREQGVLFGSGLVGGEGVLGVIVAGVVFWKSLEATQAQEVPLPLEIGSDWLQRRRVDWLDRQHRRRRASSRCAAGLAALAAVFARCCRTR